MIKYIDTPQSYLTVFPNPPAVFADPVEKYARHLLPLLTIDLCSINPSWDGSIHLVCPVEPNSCLVGEFSQAYHNDFLKTNWLAFRLGKDSRYELLGDFRYFLLENPDMVGPSPGYRESLEKYYKDIHLKFIEARTDFQKNGQLRGYLVDQLGGELPFMNWTVFCYDNGIRMNVSSESDPEAMRSVYPISQKGNRFYFVAAAPASTYVSKCGVDLIVVFYEPVERIAWLTFDYS